MMPGKISLLEKCLQVVGQNSSAYLDETFEDLPEVLLSALTPYLTARRLLHLNSIFVKKRINTEKNWMSHFEYRWRQCEKCHLVFRSQQTTPMVLYMNKHFQEIFYHAVEGRWEDALYIDTKMNQCRHRNAPTSFIQLGQMIPLSLKVELVKNLEYYSTFIDRHSIYCAHIERVLQTAPWLSFLSRITAIRLIMLTDTNVEATLKLLHHLRKYGYLQEINVSTCRLNSEYATTFTNFCNQVTADDSLDLYAPIQHLYNTAMDSDGDDFGLDLSEPEQSCAKRLKLSADDSNDINQSSDAESSCDNDCSIEDNLYDTALLEPLSICLPKSDRLPATDQDELRLILRDVKTSSVDGSSYSRITCFSVDDNDHSNGMTSLLIEVGLPRWTHLRALAVEELQNKEESKTNCVLYSGMKCMFEYPCFEELQATHSSILCILLALINAKRNKALKFLKLEHDKFSGLCSCEQNRSNKHDWSSCCCVENLALTYYNGHLYIEILQNLIRHDTALQSLSAYYTGYVSTPHDLDIGHILGALRDREIAENPGLGSLDISRACRITVNPDYFTSSLSPVKFASLKTLKLTVCRLYLMNGLCGVFADDLIKHPNLRELDLSYNRLQKTGCNLLMIICRAIMEGVSRLKTIDFSYNDMTCRDLVPVARRVSSMIAERQTDTPHMGRFGDCLLLNMNHLGAACKELQCLFGKLFLHRVEAKSYDSTLYFTTNAEHLSQM